jgi:hypothetical protein
MPGDDDVAVPSRAMGSGRWSARVIDEMLMSRDVPRGA